MSYEAAREELIQVVQRLESGGAPLDESLALWERGEQLAAICQAWLDGAKSAGRGRHARPGSDQAVSSSSSSTSGRDDDGKTKRRR